MLNIKLNKFKLFASLIFIIYLVLLINVIVFKNGTASIIKMGLINKNINFLPFKTILDYLSGQEDINMLVTNILGNIISFSPLGFFIPLLFNERKGLVKTFTISFLVSLSFEAIQYQFNLGTCDIDDLILNIIGAILGFIMYKFIKYLTPNNNCTT